MKKLNKKYTDFYTRMLAAKKAKADKAKRDKNKDIEEAPKVRPQLPDTPKQRLEVTEDVPMSSMEQHTSTHAALEAALDRLEQQARGL